MLRESEIRALAEVGAFRAVTAHDLTRFRYGGDQRQAWRDLNNLARQGLIRRRTAYPDQQVYVTLTRQGHRFVEAHRPQEMDAKQVLYRGFVKPREAKHDATLYRLYQRAADDIERKGGKVQRVVLDFELKKSINTKLAKAATLPESEQAQRKQQIAEEHGLTVVDGKIPLPDLRIEYETAARDQTRVDLELATSNYHRDGLAEKTRAGFAIFALREDATPLHAAPVPNHPQPSKPNTSNTRVIYNFSLTLWDFLLLRGSLVNERETHSEQAGGRQNGLGSP